MTGGEPTLVRYVPGSAVAIAWGPILALVEETALDLTDRLWDAVTNGAEFDELVDLLVERGPSSLPSLALVEVGTAGSVRMLVRGDIGLQVERTAGDGLESVEVTAPGVRTWVEHVLSDVQRVILSAADAFDASVGRFVVTGGYFEATRLEAQVGELGFELGDPSLARERLDALGPSLAAPEPIRMNLDPVELDDPDEDDDPNEKVQVEANDVVASAEADAPPESMSSATIVGPFDELESASLIATSDDLQGDGPGFEEAVGIEPPAREDDDSYDHLFGATQFRTVDDAAVRVEDEAQGPDDRSDEPVISAVPGQAVAPSPGARPATDAAEAASDRDGMTMSLEQLRALRGHAPAPELDHQPFAGATMVQAVECPVGHLNPPHAGLCRVCGAPVPAQEHVTVPRPILGQLRLPDGRVVPLSGSVIVGRSPRLDGSVGPDAPEIVKVDSPNKEVSGTHAELRVDGWQIVVVDRQSTNGTTVRMPGRNPQRLRAGEPSTVTLGTVISLGDEVEIVVEAVP
jgi:hypothetical protein